MSQSLPGGIAHALPADLRRALQARPEALAAWQDITPLARNEWICWTVSVKQQATRDAHVARACADLALGKHRPCCWVGCVHRTDKPVGAWARNVLLGRQPKT